ncbi:unnamed protein product [Closterium sp. NIES-53]
MPLQPLPPQLTFRLVPSGCLLMLLSNWPFATECAHFGEHRAVQALYDAVVARYSSPATAAIGRLLLPYLFPELSAFTTLDDLVTHLRTSDARYRATVPAEFLPTNQPPMFITLYFIVTRLPDSLTQALHTFTLDSGASRCFFLVSTTLTPLPARVPVSLDDPSGGPVIASPPQSSRVRQFRPAHRSSLYTLTTEPTQVVASAQVSASGQVAPPCSCRLLSHQTLLWHHRLGHPSLPRLRGMHSRLLVSGLPRSLPPLPPSPAPPCLPCVEGRQRAAPHSSSFPPTTAPLQTLHMDVWGPARVNGQGRERYFLLVVDDYTRYTTVFPLRSKGEVSAVLIPWIRTVRLQLRARFGQDLLVMRLHSDRGGEFSFDLLRDFCRGEGISQSFTLPDSPQQNGIAERRIGLVMEVARTSMIHAAVPHFLWPFAVRYAAHQLNLWPRVSLPETSPTLRWTGKVGNASVFRVWGSRAFVRDTSVDKLSARAIPFSGRHVRRGPAPSGVSQVDPLPGTAPVQVAVVLGAAPGAASGGVEPRGAGSEGAGSRGAEPEGVEPGGAESEGAEPEDAESEGVESWGAEPRAPGAGKPGDAGAGGAAVTTGAGDPTEPGAAGAGGAGAGVAAVGSPSAGGAGAARAGAVDPGAGGAGGTVRPRPYFVPLLQQVLGVPSSTGLPPPFLCPPPDQSQPPLQPASPLPVPSPYTEQSRGLSECREPTSRPVSPVRTARRAPRSRPPPVPGTHTMALRPSSVPLCVPLPAPPESSLPEVPDPESDRARAASPTVARLLATTVTDPSFESAVAPALVAELLDFAAACRLDYTTALVAESVSASPPSVGGECALGTDILEDKQEDFECLAAAVPRFASLLLAPEGDPDAPDIPTPRSYAEVITGRYSSQLQAAMDVKMASWKSTGTYVDEVPPPGVNIVDGMWIFRVKRPPGSPPAFKARYVARGTQWSLCRPVYGLRQAPHEWHDTFRTTLAALGFVPSTADPSLFLHTDTSLPAFYILVYVDNLVFATADTEALTLVKSELQKRHTCTHLGELRSYLGLQITRDRARHTITLTQSHMVHQVLQRFGFQYSSPQLTPLSNSHLLSAPPSDESVEPSGPYPELVGCLMYLMTYTRPDLAYPLSLLARYVAPGRHQKVHWDVAKRVLRYLCSTTGMRLVLGGWGPVVLTVHADASWVDDSATQRSSQGYTFSLGSGSVSWCSTHSSSVLSSSCEAEIHAGAMAAQELRWLTYLLTNLGEQPRLPLVLYVDNKAMIALCQEHRLEHRTKHIALRYFLARELQQRGLLRLAYVATWVNTADVFTKALPPGHHQRFVTVLGLCFVQLTDRLHAQYGFGPSPDWAPLVHSRGLALFEKSALQLFEALRSYYAMYADVDYSASRPVCSRLRSLDSLPVASIGTCVSSLGASVVTSPGAPTSDVSLSFTLNSGASQCFFRDHMSLTPLSAPISVALADPTLGPAVARSTTTLPCPGTCMDCETYAPLAIFYQEHGSGIFTLHTDPPYVDVSGQVAASSQVATSCSCRSLAHPIVLWHHHLGHPSLPRLRSMASQRLVSGLPRVFLSLPPSPAPPCSPCIEGRLHATPHSSSLCSAAAPFETLHLDVWGPAPRLGPGRESFFLVVVDDYSRYTTVFPLAKKSAVNSTLIRWLLATETTRGRHTLPESPQQNGVAERRIGLVMEIARTSMIHARASHFLWPYAVRYAAHQLNLWPRVSWPEASMTSLWTGSPGVASEFHWTPLTTPFTTRPSTSSLTLATSDLMSLCLTTPGTPIEVSRFSPLPFSSPLLLLLPLLLQYTRPPPGLAPSGVSHATPIPSVARQVLSPSPQLSSQSQRQPSALPQQVAIDSGGVGVGGTSTSGASSKGAGAEGTDAGGACSEGAGAEGTDSGGASSGGACAVDTSSGGAGAGARGAGAVGAGEAGAGVATAAAAASLAAATAVGAATAAAAAALAAIAST